MNKIFCIECRKYYYKFRMVDDMTCIYCDRKIDYNQTTLEEYIS